MQQTTHNMSQDEIVGQLGVEVLFTWGRGGQTRPSACDKYFLHVASISPPSYVWSMSNIAPGHVDSGCSSERRVRYTGKSHLPKVSREAVSFLHVKIVYSFS